MGIRFRNSFTLDSEADLARISNIASVGEIAHCIAEDSEWEKAVGGWEAFVGVPGPRGEQGPQGDPGAPGQDGADGADGQDGASGTVVKSGVVNLTAGGSANVTFNTPFASTPHVVLTSQFNSADTSTTLSAHSVTVNGFTLRGAGNAAGNVAWLACSGGNP